MTPTPVHIMLAMAWGLAACILLIGAALRRSDQQDAKTALAACKADPACDKGAERVLNRRHFVNKFLFRMKLLLGLYAAVRVYISLYVMWTPVGPIHWADVGAFILAACMLFWYHMCMRRYE